MESCFSPLFSDALSDPWIHNQNVGSDIQIEEEKLFCISPRLPFAWREERLESQSGNSAAICTPHHWPEFSASLNSFRSSGPNLCGCLSAYLCPMSYCHFCPVLYSHRFLLTFNCSCSTSVIILKVFPFPIISEDPQRLLHGSQILCPLGFYMALASFCQDSLATFARTTVLYVKPLPRGIKVIWVPCTGG